MNKIKILLFFSLFFFPTFFMNCKEPTAKFDKPFDTVAVNTVGQLTFDGWLYHDTIKLYKSLHLSDSLLRVSHNNKVSANLYQNKVKIYLMLGDIDNAIENMKKVASYYPENSVLSMGYQNMRAIASHNADEEKRILRKNLSICDSTLSKSYRLDVSYFKLQTLYLLHGKEKAAEYLHIVKKQHPNPLYPSSNSEWEEFCSDQEAQRKQIYEMSTTKDGGLFWR